MECITKPNINCCKDGECTDLKCPSSHSCCWQDPKNGKAATLGVCVKRDSKGGNTNCDFSRGLPKMNCRDPLNIYKSSNLLNYERDGIREGYDDEDDNEYRNEKDSAYLELNNAFFILFLLIVFLVFLAAFLHLNCYKNQF